MSQPPAAQPPQMLQSQYLGKLSYEDSLELQKDAVERLQEGIGQEQLLLFETEPTLTMGSSSKDQHLLLSPKELEARGFTVLEARRGGDITYHGPGQLVGFPILRLQEHEKDLPAYLRNLEQVLIEFLAAYEIVAGRKEGMTGVWVGDEKIAAMGIHVARWVTSHGFALNVHTQLEHFDTIVPCGIREYGVTSMKKLLAKEFELPLIAKELAEQFAKFFARQGNWLASTK